MSMRFEVGLFRGEVDVYVNKLVRIISVSKPQVPERRGLGLLFQLPTPPLPSGSSSLRSAPRPSLDNIRAPRQWGDR
jgi:hypothetical protein